MEFKNLLMLVLVLLYSTSEGSPVATSPSPYQGCCDKGKLRARSLVATITTTIVAVDPELMTDVTEVWTNERCVAVEYGCLLQYFRKKEKCQVGVKDAINKRQACDTISNTYSRICCQSCRDGRLANQLECSRPLSGHTNTTEMLAGDAFMECCELNRCKNNPCEHQCQDNTGEPKVKCSCRTGYQLMADGKSCTLQGGENIPARLAEGSPELQNGTRMAGEAPHTQAKAAPTNILVIHSQTNEVLQCSSGHVKLWEGYSLYYKDMANTGSCLRKFSPALIQPFATYSTFRGYISYWLTTELPVRASEIKGEEMIHYVSRCTVCEVWTNVIAVHSQSKNVPSCPSGWDELWVGYSFVAYAKRGSQFDATDMQAGPGSCLRHFRRNPVIQCGGAPDWCMHRNSGELSYWLGVDGVDSEDPHSSVSRCSVCIKK